MLKKFKQQISCLECSSPPTAQQEIYLPSKRAPYESTKSFSQRRNNKPEQRRPQRPKSLSETLNATGSTSGYSTDYGNVHSHNRSPGGSLQRNHSNHGLRRPSPGYPRKQWPGGPESYPGNESGSSQHDVYSRAKSVETYESQSGYDTVDVHGERTPDTSVASNNANFRNVMRAVPGRRYQTLGFPGENRRQEDHAKCVETHSLPRSVNFTGEHGTDETPEVIDTNSPVDEHKETLFRSRRSISFAGSCPYPFVGAKERRQRSRSVTDSEGTQSGISGEGLENTLIGFVKREWHSQAHIASDNANHYNQYPRSILKNTTKSFNCASDDVDFAERRARSTSVTFLDTKYNESQLFNSSRYKREHAKTISYPTRNNSKQKHKHKLGHADGKPPLPRKYNEEGAKVVMNRYHNLRSHNRSPPPTNDETNDFLELGRRTSKDSSDSGAYSSSINSSVSTDSRLEPSSVDDVFRSPQSSLCSDSGSMGKDSNSSRETNQSIKLSPNGKSIPDIMKISINRNRNRRSTSRMSTNSNVSNEMANTSIISSRSSDSIRPPGRGNTGKDVRLAIGMHTPHHNDFPQNNVQRDAQYTSSDNISSDSQSGNGQRPSYKYDPTQPLTTSNQRLEQCNDSLTSSEEDLDKTLCKEDFYGKNDASDGTENEQDKTLCETNTILDLNHNKECNKNGRDTKISRHTLVKHITPGSPANINKQFVSDLIPEFVRSTPKTRRKSRTSEPRTVGRVPHATSIENLRTGRKMTMFENVSVGSSDLESDTSSIAESAGHMRRKSMEEIFNDPSCKLDLENTQSKIITSSDFIANYIDDGYSQQGSLQSSNKNTSQPETEIPANTLDWELDPDDLPESSINTISNQSWQQMSDLMTQGTEDDLKSFMNQNDLSHLLIPRNNIRTGRLMMKDDNNTFCMCSGSYRVPAAISKRSIPHCKPTTIQVYRCLNDKEDRINLLKNVMALRQLSHRCVQTIYGMALEGSPHTRDGREVMILHERMHYLVTMKNLLAWTSENNPQLMTPMCTVTFAMQLSEGLQFLEKRGIIHANLSSSTVRLDPQCKLKLGGIEQFPVSSTPAPIRSMSLETLSTGDIQAKSIVWTFGVLVWEIVSLGARPYNNLKTGQILHRLTKGYRLPCPANCSKFIYQLLVTCWLPQPQERPTFRELSKTLEEYQLKLSASKLPTELFPDRDDFWNILHEHI